MVAAFEQFQKLRPASSNSDRLLEGVEVTGEQGEMSSSPVPPAQSGTLNNVRSCGSLTSISSHTSATSGSSSEEAKKKEQRRHWVSLSVSFIYKRIMVSAHFAHFVLYVATVEQITLGLRTSNHPSGFCP